MSGPNKPPPRPPQPAPVPGQNSSNNGQSSLMPQRRPPPPPGTSGASAASGTSLITAIPTMSLEDAQRSHGLDPATVLNTAAATTPQSPRLPGVLAKLSSAVQDLLVGEPMSSGGSGSGGGGRRLEISSPFEFKHEVHVGFVSETGEFTGLPPQWKALLENSGISKQEQQKHPQAVLDVLDFYSESAKHDFDYRQMDTSNSNPSPPQQQMQKTTAATTNKPIPPRPQHTLSVYSTDLPGKVTPASVTNPSAPNATAGPAQPSRPPPPPAASKPQPSTTTTTTATAPAATTK